MKNLLHASCFAFAALLASGVPAQETEQPAVPKPNELIQQLGDPSYRERRAAEEELRKLGASATDALREAAEQHGDAEVRWRAGRLLRQIEDGSAEGRLRTRQPAREDRVEVTPDRQGRLRTLPLDHVREMQQQFDEMFRQLEREFGIDVPSRRFFHDDFFRDLEEQMQQLRTFPQGGQGESMQMQIGPDGVRVEVKRVEDGQEKTDVYEAPDMESFRAKYPDIAKRHFGGGLQFRGFDMPGPLRPFQFDVRQRGALPPVTQPRPAQPPPQPIDPNDPNRLGVMVAEVAPEVRAFLGLAADQGLYVQSIVEGSLAATLGIESGDILLEIAGQQIGAVGDVRNALTSVEAGAKVEVVVNRRGVRKQLTATKQTVELAEPKDRGEQPDVSEPQEPATPPQSEPGEGAPKSGGKLRRIR